MKNLKYLLLLVLIGLFAACEENQPILFSDAAVVFEGPNQSITESVGGLNLEPNTTTITVSRTNTDISQALTINYTTEAILVSTGATVSDVFSISGTAGQFTIPANQYSTSVTLSTINNIETDGTKEVTITMTSADGAINIGYPGPDSPKKSIKIFIEDDDCPFDIDNFLGDYNCDEPAYSSIYDVSFTLKPGTTNTIINDNFWFSNASVEYVLNPDNNTITIPLQSVDGDYGNMIITGSGTIEPCTGKMTVNYSIDNEGFIENDVHIFTRK